MSELLLIDDDQELCELLSSWLSQEGFQVRACHDGQSARKALAESAPAAVVLDVMLPDGSGLELLKQLRSEHADLPVLMLSARGEPLDRILGLELGADDYLAKPCDPRELTARLRETQRREEAAITYARNVQAEAQQMQQRLFRTDEERLHEAKGRIETRLGRSPHDRKKMAVLPDTSSRGKHAVTHYRTLELQKRGLRERIVKVEEAAQKSFAVGRFDLITERIDTGEKVSSVSDSGQVVKLAWINQGQQSPEQGRIAPQLSLCRSCLQYIYPHEVICPHCNADVAAAEAEHQTNRARQQAIMNTLTGLLGIAPSRLS